MSKAASCERTVGHHGIPSGIGPVALLDMLHLGTDKPASLGWPARGPTALLDTTAKASRASGTFRRRVFWLLDERRGDQLDRGDGVGPSPRQPEAPRPPRLSPPWGTCGKGEQSTSHRIGGDHNYSYTYDPNVEWVPVSEAEADRLAKLDQA